MKDLILKALFAANLLLISFQSQADEVETKCAGLLQGSAGLSYSKINARLFHLFTNSRGPEIKFWRAKEDLNRFWREGWPYLKLAAFEDETTILALMQEYFALQELVQTGLPDRHGVRVPAFRQRMQEAQASIVFMENFSEGQKLKPNVWRQIESIYNGLMGLGYLAYSLESNWRPAPSFDPLAPLTSEQLNKIFESLEISGLEQAANLIENYHKSQQSEKAESNIEAAALDVESSEQTATEPAPHNQITEPSHQLAIILAADKALSSDILYEASSPFGSQLRVELSNELIEQYHGVEHEAVTKLLRTLVTGGGGSSGVKTLFDIGPKIVEVKARMRGHKRLVGCLEGRRLVLKKIMDIKASRATYARRIPANFCS